MLLVACAVLHAGAATHLKEALMRPNTVKQQWREGKAALGAWLSIPSTYTAEVMAHQGFDWLCIDTQHGMLDYTMAVGMMQAISTTDTIPFVRVPWNEPSIIMKYLDAGAYGIVIPMVNNHAEAERAVAACRYPPQGIRSSGPNRVMLYAGRDYVQNANAEIACVVMIETAEALENLDDIVSTPGIDAVYIGPSDLGFALGLGGGAAADPRHAEAVARILETCNRHGVPAGYHCGNSQMGVRRLQEGFKMLQITADGASIARVASEELAAVRSAPAPAPVAANP
jgi:4-hydroxy-2-oxoheptanedioate aldolase